MSQPEPISAEDDKTIDQRRPTTAKIGRPVQEVSRRSSIVGRPLLGELLCVGQVLSNGSYIR